MKDTRQTHINHLLKVPGEPARLTHGCAAGSSTTVSINVWSCLNDLRQSDRFVAYSFPFLGQCGGGRSPGTAAFLFSLLCFCSCTELY